MADMRLIKAIISTTLLVVCLVSTGPASARVVQGGIFTDGFEGEPPPFVPCDDVALGRSSVGCNFYAIDAHNLDNDGLVYAVGVVNTGGATAQVQIQTRNGDNWDVVDSASVLPAGANIFTLPDRHIANTGFNAAGAYRVQSDQPIAAYQFQPVDGQSSFTSDTSLLLPVAIYDQSYMVAGWGQASFGSAQLDVVASEDNTVVTITPSINTLAGGGIPALTAGMPYQHGPMMAGDVLQIESALASTGFSGSVITADKNIAVFSTHSSANVPEAICCTDHLEEQLTGLQAWGQTIVASRFPVRSDGSQEASYWQLVASEANTTVSFDKNMEVAGLPAGIILNGGEFVEFAVSGSAANPGDFVVTADKPILLMQYLSGSGLTNVPAAQAADPAMAQAAPVEQYRDSYQLLVPLTWDMDFLVITKPAGASVEIDGAGVPQESFIAVGTGGAWETARVPVTDGVHTVTATAPVSVTVVGYDSFNSYAYPAGLNQAIINPQ